MEYKRWSQPLIESARSESITLLRRSTSHCLRITWIYLGLVWCVSVQFGVFESLFGGFLKGDGLFAGLVNILGWFRVYFVYLGLV